MSQREIFAGKIKEFDDCPHCASFDSHMLLRNVTPQQLNSLSYLIICLRLKIFILPAGLPPAA
ncbi:hypothetical protein [Kosakonia oryzae]|uniref:hypothetical protein n=1 Tax=Kosakonia oryzae TaxID=497725 RepID=UPI001D077C86|nr:hypothetical protein [Kosakonia oryzae]UDJ80534.1 hypothetical protein I5186_15080 [Kosakonia oryzae]